MGKIQTAILFFFLAAGCQKMDSSNYKPPPLSDSIISPAAFPDKVGDKWHYLVKDTALNVVPDSLATQYIVDVSIVGKRRLPDNRMVTIWQSGYPDHTDSNYVYASGDSITILRHDLTYMGTFILPSPPGSTWSYLPVDTFEYKQEIKEGTITIGDSVYRRAWEIHHWNYLPDASYELDEWYKDSVGLIKKYFNNAFAFINNKHIQDWSLISYELK